MISIIVPVYNAEKYIENTIKMVLAQTYSDWELILVDDCSADGSVQVIERVIEEVSDLVSPKIRLLRQPDNLGAAAARNRGIDEAHGRYIAFLDADDIWRPEKLVRQMEFMEEKQAGFTFCTYDFGDENGKPTGKVCHVPETLDLKRALPRTVIFTSTVLIDTEKVDRSLIHMPHIASEDTATWWNILKSGITGYGLDESLVVYRRPAGSLSSNKLVALKRIWDLYRQVAGLSIPESCFYFVGWAWLATWRRVVKG